MKTVWTPFDSKASVFVPRCGKCGTYKIDLYVHWFFRGPYCVRCIQNILYDNCRTIQEINGDFKSV